MYRKRAKDTNKFPHFLLYSVHRHRLIQHSSLFLSHCKMPPSYGIRSSSSLIPASVPPLLNTGQAERLAPAANDELLPIAKTGHGRQLLTDKCQRWLQHRSDFSKRGDSRVKTEDPPSFYAQQALRSKSEGIRGKTRGLVLIAAKPDKPCFICGCWEWWWRKPSPLGGPGEWLCGCCHPRPNNLPGEDDE